MSHMDKRTADAELDHYKRIPPADLLVRLGFSEYHGQKTVNGKLVKDTEVAFELGGCRVKPFSQPSKTGSGHYMVRFAQSSSMRPHGGREFGTIVDVVALIEGGNLGRARQRLRSVTGYAAPSTFSTDSTPVPAASVSHTSPAPSLPPLDHDSTDEEARPTAEELEAAYKAFGPAWKLYEAAPDYLASRHLDDIHPVFHETFRVSQNKRGTIAFPYRRFTDDGCAFVSARPPPSLPDRQRCPR